MNKEISYFKKALVMLMAVMMVFTMMPSMAWADGETEAGGNESTPSITTYVSVTINGELQKAKDETYMAYKEVTVTDTDGDGKISLNDVMVCTHMQYFDCTDENIGYAPAAEDEKGIATFWGKNKEDGSLKGVFFHIIDYGTASKSGTGKIDSEIDMRSFEVSEGQYISASSIGNNTGAGLFASYGKTSSATYFLSDVSVPKDKEFQLTLWYGQRGGGAACLLDYNIYVVDESGKNITALSDSNGQETKTVQYYTAATFNVSFSRAGTYTLVTEPNVKNETYGAAAIRVHVYEDSPISVTNAKVGTTDSLKDNMITFEPDTKEYNIIIPETCDYLYGSINYDNIDERKSDIAGKIEINKKDVWNSKDGNSGVIIKSTKLDNTVWSARLVVADKYVTNAAFEEYNLNIKRKALIKGITTDLILTDEFSSDVYDYVATIDPATEKFSIKPTTNNASHTVTINGKTANINADNIIELSSLQFDENRADLTITVSNSDERYVASNYKITLVKAAAEDTPTFILQPEEGKYIIGDTATPLNVHASAKNEVSYQWYSNTTNSTQGATPIDGETNATLIPPTTTAGTIYYFCKAKNGEYEADSNVVQVKVYPDPKPTIRWEEDIPEFSEEEVAYLQSKYDSGELPSYAKNETGKYCGYYYHQNEKNVAKITASAVSAAEDGEMTYRWTRRTGTAADVNFHKEAAYMPDTSIAYGECEYSVQAVYTLLEKEYVSDRIYVYVYVDTPEVIRPDTITWDGSGTKDDPYLIEDATDLEELRLLVNSGYSFENQYLALADNIALDIKWKGIGEGDGYASQGVNFKPFSGTLDGKGHTISYAKGSKYPLFNYVREATVKNLNLYAPYIDNYGLVANYVVDYGADGNYNIGTGGSYAPGCPDTIDINNVTIKSGSMISQSGFIGGGASGGNVVNIVGCTVEKNVKIGCTADGTSAGKSDIGSFAGSICGSVIGCVSYADVYGSSLVAGIVARKAQSMSNFNISNNAFLGSIHATGNYIGGIVAQGYYADSAPNTPCVSITNCYADAAIVGGNYVGGIFGGEPGIYQTWEGASAGYIRDNAFYGTVQATAENGYTGAIVGHMKSLNRYNYIEKNYYLNTCGTSKAIGKVDIVDTTATGEAEGVNYINTKGATASQLKELDKKLVKDYKASYSYIAKADHNRTDDPLGKDAEKLAKAVTASELKDGTVLKLMNTSESSYKNWIQGANYPVHSDETVLYAIELSGNYKTEYVTGETLNTDGMLITQKYSDGTTKTIPASEANAKFTGFKSNERGVQTITVTCGVATTTYEIRVLYSGSQIKDGWTAYITVLGDSEHEEPDAEGGPHTLSAGNLKTWVPKTKVTINNNTSVYDVIKRVLGEESLEGSANNQYSTMYISGVKIPGTDKYLSEFSNGNYSGWMYTLNGHHSELGVAQQFLNDGDEIIFHYTDDYTKEEGSDKWNTSGGGVIEEVKEVTTDTKTGITTAPTEVKVTEKVNADGTKEKVAEVKVTADNQKEILKQAKANKSKEIILSVATKAAQDATKAEVTLDKSFIDSIVKDTDANLTVKTPFGDKTYTQDELKALSAAATGNAVTIAVEKAAEEPEEPAADVKALTAKLTPVARSAKTAKKNVKVTVSLDKQDKEIISQLKKAGYTVKYRFYRSTKKSAGYKSTVTKKTATYTNTRGKKGTKYFYKVQVRVYDENGKLVAKTALKQCKYASRTWSR